MATSLRIEAAARRGALAPLLIAAGVVLVSDLASKQWALLHLAGSDRWIWGGLHLTIVHNDGLAWGMHAGGFGLQITAVLTVALVALVAQVCGPLMAVDALAPIALGLLVGAGAANLLDALTAPSGVVDFIAFTRSGGETSVLNVADLFAAVGFVLLLRTAFCLMRAMDATGGDARPKSIVSAARVAGASRSVPGMIVSIGHGFAAMCAFVWLYSLVIVWAPDAGRSAPSTMLCAVAVFAASFVASQAWSWIGLRRRAEARTGERDSARPPLEIVVDREPARDGPRPARSRCPAAAAERVVLDGSLAAAQRAPAAPARPARTRGERDGEVEREVRPE